MYDILLTIFTNTVEILIIRRFIRLFFNAQIAETKKELFAYSLFFIVTTFDQLYFHQPILNMIVNLFGLFWIIYIYSNNLKKNLFLSLGIYAVCTICEVIAIFTFLDYQAGDRVNKIYAVFTILLILLSEIIIERIFTHKYRAELISHRWILLLIVPVVSVSMLYLLLVDLQYKRYLMLVEGLGLLFINIIIFFLYNMIQWDYVQKSEKDRLKQQIKQYRNQLEIITESQEKIKTMQHDLKHHMLELYNRAQENKDQPVIDYIKSMRNYIENPMEYLYSGNKEFDSILNYMIQKAKTVLKTVETKINIPEAFDFHSFELNVILGNLLENAIEASCQSDERKLSLTIEMEKGILFINILNSYQGSIEKNGGKYLTSKKNKSLHGYGIESVRRMVEQNHGMIKMGCDEVQKLFSVSVMLYGK